MPSLPSPHSSCVTRRTLLKTGASAAVVAALPRPLLVSLGPTPEPVPPIDDPRLKALALRALEAAKSAGAAYADVRLTYSRRRSVFAFSVGDRESMTVGVRALVEGYWGFAASPVWSADELARLGREAVHQAKVNAVGKPRIVELAPVPVVADGHWVMPVKRDPFAVPIDEVRDFLTALGYWGKHRRKLSLSLSAGFRVQEKAFGSTAGSYCTQRLFTSDGFLEIIIPRPEGEKGYYYAALNTLTEAGVGWELITEQPLRDLIDAAVEETLRDAALPVRSVEVGRYDMVFDAESMANILDSTLGSATQLDRALGYEANAGGTSYLNRPLEMLGSYQVGVPQLTVTANRSEPGGAATVQWDDEGVVPEPFPLVQDGVLRDFQTMRESAGWLKDYYTRQNRAVTSHGCAAAPEGVDAPLVHTPNLVMAPGREALDFDTLVSGVSAGIAISSFGPGMDFQGLNGLGMGNMYEIKRGKRVARIIGAGVLFRSPELWKGLLALGGPASAQRYGLDSVKGEPEQRCVHSVTAVPALVKQLTLIDVERKA